MRSYGAILIGMPTTMLLMLWVLQSLQRGYERVTGRAPDRRREPRAWLRSMRGERSSRRGLGVGERILVASVVVAAVLDAAWFFVLAHPGLPNG